MVTTRFAPSPTGFLHIGSLRTALYAYLLAKKHGGTFILRVEDTDQMRYNPEAIPQIISSLQWAGIKYDEGPDVGGPHGPYFQTERRALYAQYAQQLLDSGHAYHCFCTKERLQALREDQQKNKLAPKYDGHCRHLTPAEVQQRLAAGEPHVIRMIVPDNRILEFQDGIRGKITFNTKDQDDQVIMKSDGLPTYFLAVVVDDHLMEVTHVIRSEEWLSSTPKVLLLYEYLGWECPIIAHPAFILGQDGKKKLSKREGAASVDIFIRDGYLPEAILNFVAFLGWNPGTEQEFFTLDELAQAFSLERCQKSGAIYDLKRLLWMNGQYIRRYDVHALCALIKPFIEKQDWYRIDDDYLAQAVTEIQTRLELLSQAPDMLEPFYRPVPYELELICNPKMKVTPDSAHASLTAIQAAFATVDTWDKNTLQKILMDLVATHGWSNGQVFWPLRAALSGRPSSPGAYEMAAVLGQTETQHRLETALAKLTH